MTLFVVALPGAEIINSVKASVRMIKVTELFFMILILFKLSFK